jgi:hypothetical protein
VRHTSDHAVSYGISQLAECAPALASTEAAEAGRQNQFGKRDCVV